jgi:hypothetical protein
VILGTFRTPEGFAVIKSELVDRISIQNPHLYRQDVEKIVNTIFSEIAAAMARGDRVDGVWGFFCKVSGRPERTKSSHRGAGFGRKKGRSFLQDRKGHEVSAELICARLRYPPESLTASLTSVTLGLALALQRSSLAAPDVSSASTSVRMLAVARGLAPGIDWSEGTAGALPVQGGEQFDVVVC